MEMTRNQTHHIIMTAIYNELVAFNYGEKGSLRDIREILGELCFNGLNGVLAASTD